MADIQAPLQRGQVIETAAVVRFGQTLYVVAFTERTTTRDISREAAEAAAVARFEFEGRAVRSNPSFTAAMVEAQRAVTRAVRPGVSTEEFNRSFRARAAGGIYKAKP